MQLKHDTHGISELVLILALVAVILVLVLVVFGGIAITLGVFFGGRLGIGFLFFIIGLLVFGATLVPQLHVQKQVIYLAYALLGLGVLFLVLGVLNL